MKAETYLLASVRDIGERKQTEAIILETTRRLNRQNETLRKLASSQTNEQSTLTNALREITESATVTLDAARASVWRYNKKRTKIRCMDLYDKRDGHHEKGKELDRKDFPNYFNALLVDQIVPVDDVANDPRTSGFYEKHLKPNQVTAILDAPINVDGKIIGTVNIEATGAPRKWHLEEQTFVNSLAEIVANHFNQQRRRLAEEKLSQSEVFYQTLIDHSFDVFTVLEESGTIRYSSSSQKYIFGHPMESLIGKHFDRFIHPEDRASALSAIERVSQEEKASEMFIYRYQDGQGNWPWVESVAQNMVHIPGVEGMVINTRVVDERIQSRKQLEQQEKLFRALIENSSDVLLISNEDLKFDYVSPSVKRILGYFPRDFADVDIRELVLPEHRKVVRKAFEQCLANPGKPITSEFSFLHQNGNTSFLEVIFYNLLHDEAVSGIVMNCRDVSERKEAERIMKDYNIRLEEEVNAQTQQLSTKNEELQTALENLTRAQAKILESEKLASLGALTAGVAHEINNPINFVSANIKPVQRDFEDIRTLMKRYIQLHQSASLKEDLAALKEEMEKVDPDFLFQELDELLQGIEEGAKRTKEIVLGLRNFSRMDEHGFKRANINEGLQNTLMLLTNKTKHRIEVKTNFGDLPMIDCHPGKLNQVFMNLLSNAIEAIPGKGRIQVRTRTEQDHVIVTISDSGNGIESATLKRIFEPFFTTKDVGKGTGLGLSISFGIIKDHKGTIDAESEIGKGTTFTITLPINQ